MTNTIDVSEGAIMRKHLLPVLLLAIFCGSSLIAASPAGGPPEPQPKANPNVSVVSLIVLREADEAAMRALIDYPAGSFKTGVMLVGRLNLPAGNVVSVDKALRVDKFSDEKGTDLGNGLVKQRMSRDDGVQSYVSPDRKQCTFWLGSTQLPAPGAERLLVEGSLGLRMGVGEKVGESKVLPVKLAQEYTTGDAVLKVQEISSDPRQGGFYMSFSSTIPPEMLKSIECNDGEGKPVALQLVDGRRTPGMIAILLVRPVKEMSLRIATFEKVEDVKLPVNLNITLGL